MNIKIDVYHHFASDPAQERWQDTITRALHQLKEIVMTTQEDVEQIKADQAATKANLDNISADVNGLNTKIQELNDLVAALQQGQDLTEVKTTSAALAAQSAEIAGRTPDAEPPTT